MSSAQNMDWLMKVSCPPVKYRTITELNDSATDKDRADAKLELLHCTEVEKWRKLLNESDKLHGSDSHAFENSLAKLAAYGITAKMNSVTEDIHSVYSKLTEGERDNGIVYPFFVSIGYEHNGSVSRYAEKRLNTIYSYIKDIPEDFTKSDDATGLLLTVKEKAELHIPKKWNDKHVWKPEITSLIPHCYDFYLFSHMRGHDKKRSAILSFVNTPKFQKLCKLREFERSYGWNADKKYCWSTWTMPYFHGYHGMETIKYSPNRFLLYLDLASRFPNAKDIDWVQNGVEHLETYRLDNGHYKFPAEYLLERKNGYYLYTGARMRLGETGSDSLEIESTFRMELLKKRLRA